MIDYSDLILEVASDSLNSLERDKPTEEGGVTCRQFEVKNKKEESEVGRKIGRYYAYESDDYNSLSIALSNQLRQELPDKGSVLIIAFGNPRYVADKLGTASLDRIALEAETFDNVNGSKSSKSKDKYKIFKLYPLCENLTNISSFNVVKATIDIVKPNIVIAIDTLATRKPSRVAKSIQLTTAGVTPGGGVGNAQPTINSDSLGVNTIAIGTPLIISSQTLEKDCPTMHLTVANIDEIVIKSAEIIAKGINLALY